MPTPKQEPPLSFVDSAQWYLPDVLNDDAVYYHEETLTENGRITLRMKNKAGDIKVMSFLEATVLHLVSLGLIELDNNANP